MKLVILIILFFLSSCSSTKTIGRLEGRAISGNIVRFEWRALNGGNLMSKSGYYTTFRVDAIGVYGFELTGFDSVGRYGKDTVQVKVTK